jgi:hypothetical protein
VDRPQRISAELEEAIVALREELAELDVDRHAWRSRPRTAWTIQLRRHDSEMPRSSASLAIGFSRSRASCTRLMIWCA